MGLRASRLTASGRDQYEKNVKRKTTSAISQVSGALTPPSGRDPAGQSQGGTRLRAEESAQRPRAGRHGLPESDDSGRAVRSARNVGSDNDRHAGVYTMQHGPECPSPSRYVTCPITFVRIYIFLKVFYDSYL